MEHRLVPAWHLTLVARHDALSGTPQNGRDSASGRLIPNSPGPPTVHDDREAAEPST